MADRVFYVGIRGDGRVMFSGMAAGPLAELPPAEGIVYHEVLSMVDPNAVWWRDGRLHMLPQRPSHLHWFDPGQWRWRLDEARAGEYVRGKRERMLQAVDCAKARAEEYRQALHEVADAVPSLR